MSERSGQQKWSGRACVRQYLRASSVADAVRASVRTWVLDDCVCEARRVCGCKRTVHARTTARRTAARMYTRIVCKLPQVQHRCGQQQKWSDGPSVDKDLDCQPADGS